MPECIREKEVITRKEHKCWGCCKKFPAKTKMFLNTSITENNEILSCYFCEDCKKYIEKEYRSSKYPEGIEYGFCLTE